MANQIETLGKIIFTFASLTLMLLAAALIVYAGAQVVWAFTEPASILGSSLLGAVGYAVIAIAIFDAAKYILVEEVVRGREMRHAGEARRSLTKFISTIVIAVMLESLVTVSEAAKGDLREMLYPILLLLSGIALLVGLGVFQRLSASVEMQIGGERGELAEEAAAEHVQPNPRSQ
jgi:hypothetical protein